MYILVISSFFSIINSAAVTILICALYMCTFENFSRSGFLGQRA